MFVLALIQAVVVLENGKHLVKVSTTLSTHCLLISLNSQTIIAGNHVGDWEHVSLRLQRGQPVEMYLGVHRYTLLLSLLMLLQTDNVTISQITFSLKNKFKVCSDCTALVRGTCGTQSQVRFSRDLTKMRIYHF